MTGLKSDDVVEDLNRKFGKIFPLILIFEGITGIVLYFFYNGIMFIAVGIDFSVIGAIMAIFAVKKSSETNWMPQRFGVTIYMIIFLVILSIAYLFGVVLRLPYYFLEGAEDMALSFQYVLVYLFSFIGLFTSWAIVLQRHKK